MGRGRRPSILRWLLELPLRIVFTIGLVVIRFIILLRRYVPISLLLLLCAVLPLAGISLGRAQGPVRMVLLALAIVLAFAAGSLRNKR